MNIRELLKQAAQKYAQKPALIFKGAEVSFKELRDRSLALAGGLSQAGLGKGDKIAFYLPNCLEYAYSYFACFSLGATGIPLDYMLKEEELVSCLTHSEAKYFIVKTKKDLDLEKLQKQVPSLEKIITIDKDSGYPSLAALIQSAENCPDVVVQDKDPSLIMYTSGTTGKPKGILLNYKHLEGSPAAMKHFVDLSDKDVKLAAIPFSHIGGFIYLQNCIHFGITVIIMDRFNPFEFLENITSYRVTCFHIVPPMYNAILTLKQIEKFDLSSLRWVVVFGAPSSPEIMARFHKYCPNARLLNGWGMTETCPPNTVTPLDSDNIASIGKPAPHCEIKVVDDKNQECTAGEIGEIVIKGWVVMDEYYKDPEATAQMIQNGWLHTGDLGCFDQEGFLYIVGRKKEMIKVGGQIVYAPEVESALYKHEAIVEAAVIGIPDKMKGEAVKAFVILKEDSDITPEDLRYFARQHLANFKVPQLIEVRKELPKNRTGKIDKALLRTDSN
ncbi:MAG: AMP-binding protein, partial [Candidatus Omnitrophica bacterium]|nr:AMP-binding protein [Candidatus Omnitrophota bacterium]